MAPIHLCFGGDSPLGYVKNKVLLFFFCHNCIVKHNDSTKQATWKNFSQYISKYMALKVWSLKCFEQCINLSLGDRCLNWHENGPCEAYGEKGRFGSRKSEQLPASIKYSSRGETAGEGGIGQSRELSESKQSALWRQSAYRANPSTETPLLRIQNDLLEAVDVGSSAVLVLLDVSSAFDTLDHKILLRRLEMDYSITGTALEWFRSYIGHRSQFVIVDGEVSEPSTLEFGVPQGSVLGPKLYSMYTMPLGIELQRPGVKDFHYADDTQLYDSFIDKGNARRYECVKNIQESVKTTQEWLSDNKLQLNNSKTEVLIVSSKHKKSTCENLSIQIWDLKIELKSNVKNLGVMQDDKLSMDWQVSHICKAANFHLRNINRIRRLSHHWSY